MVYHGIPWYAYHGIPWFTVVNHGISYHGIPWYTMVTPWCTMVNHGKLWYDHDALRHGRTMVYHGKPWYGLPCLHHGIAWHTMFAGNLHTRTAVARLPLHQLDYLVVN